MPQPLPLSNSINSGKRGSGIVLEEIWQFFPIFIPRNRNNTFLARGHPIKYVIIKDNSD